MGNVRKTSLQATLRFPEELVTRLQAMALEREMSLSQLLSELVQVGVVSLDKDPPTLEVGRRTGEAEYSISYPSRK